jgi:hypothetical protein
MHGGTGLKANVLILLVLALVVLMAATSIVRADLQTGGDVEDRFRSTIGSWISFFESNIDWFSQAIIVFMKNVIKAIYFTVGLAGFVMWSTGISKYSGKRLIISAVLMALVSEILL